MDATEWFTRGAAVGLPPVQHSLQSSRLAYMTQRWAHAGHSETEQKASRMNYFSFAAFYCRIMQIRLSKKIDILP